MVPPPSFVCGAYQSKATVFRSGNTVFRPRVYAHRMVRLRRLQAFVLTRTPVREADRIVEAFTREEGRVRLFAPGVRTVSSRRTGHLEPLMETRLVVSHSRQGGAIREARVMRSFPRLRADLQRIAVAFAIARLVRDHTGEGVRDVRLYDAILTIIAAADRAGETPKLLLESAAVHVLRSLGGLPDLFRCTHCRNPLQENAFSLRGTQRGFWCTACGGTADAPLTDAVKLARVFLAHPVTATQVRVSADVLTRLHDMIRTLLRAHATAPAIRFGA
jgi:DNA repair protein RecO